MQKKRLMQCNCGTDTSSTMDIHGLLETRGETRCMRGVISESTGCISKPAMNAPDTTNVIYENHECNY